MIYFWAIVIYLTVLILISVYRSRQVKTQDDFMVAGRKVTTIFLVGTLVCTWIGSGSLFGGAGRAFRNGFSALWISAGAWLGIAIIYFLAPRVRRIAQYTVPDLLETRYNALPPGSWERSQSSSPTSRSRVTSSSAAVACSTS